MNEAGYKYHRKGNDFEFFTSYGAAYVVSFSQADYFDNFSETQNFLYRIDIEQLDPGPYNNLDFRISITVAEIILDFLEEDNKRVLFYICNPNDGKLSARIRKFDYWYKNLSSSDFEKYKTEIKTSNFLVEIAFIYKKNNLLAKDIPIFINKAKDSFNNK